MPIEVNLIIGLIMIFFIMSFIALWIFLFVFWILMLVDAAKREFKNDNDKVIWIILIALLNWLGAIIYYFVIKKTDKH